MKNHTIITEEKTQMGIRFDPAIKAAVEKLAAEETRTFSNMVLRLLATHPQVAPILDAQTASAN